MNKEWRYACIRNSCSEKEAFLFYLREKGAFGHMSNEGTQDANPYWWGATYSYDVGTREFLKLLSEKSLKVSRAKEIIESLKEDFNSPIVRIVGLHLERELIKFITPLHNRSCFSNK